jgi:hypothetical protein
VASERRRGVSSVIILLVAVYPPASVPTRKDSLSLQEAIRGMWNCTQFVKLLGYQPIEIDPVAGNP